MKIQIEFKGALAENRISGKSLSVYSSKFEPQLKIRYSLNNLKVNDGLLSLPSFLADWTFSIVEALTVR